MRIKLCYICIGLFVLGSCGPEKKIETTPSTSSASKYIFYPSLPNQPRFQFLTSFSKSSDIEAENTKFMDFVLGENKETPKEIIKPYGVRIFEGIIYVCDTTRGFIETINLKSKQFGYMGYEGEGQLVKPINLKIDKKRRQIFVADIGKKQILTYDLDGVFLRAYGVQNQFFPSDVDIYEDYLFVCDVKNHCIHVLDVNTGEALYKIGKAGSDDGLFFHPTNITIMNKRLYVSDTNNYRVQILDLMGNFITKFGKIGRNPGQFARGKGIAVDKSNRVYVIDAAFENLQIFDDQFNLLMFMLGPNRGPDAINLPADVEIDYDNLEYFEKYMSPKFKAEYLILITSNYGPNKVNVYAYGAYQE